MVTYKLSVDFGGVDESVQLAFIMDVETIRIVGPAFKKPFVGKWKNKNKDLLELSQKYPGVVLNLMETEKWETFMLTTYNNGVVTQPKYFALVETAAPAPEVVETEITPTDVLVTTPAAETETETVVLW